VKGVGSLLWDAVVNHLQLLEADYFDLEYTNHNGDECWLDKDKAIVKQLGSADTPLRFCVKFYTPDPGLLEDELTRYLFALQVRKDLLRGELRCSENTAALLASYVVQGEIGDFDLEEYPDPTYLAVFKFVPEHLQTHEFMAKVMDYHRQHIGESPSECDLNLLDTARKVELYGVKMQSAKDHEGVSLNLAVAHLGVLVFQHFTKINTFSWAKVRKLSFKRKKFLIKLHADTYGYYKDTVEFFFDTRDRCKLFWKRCIEHHAFFRCQVVAKVPRNKTRMVSRGSSFRYCGRTQKQLVEYVRENIGKRPHFERWVNSKRDVDSQSVSGRRSSGSSSGSSLSVAGRRTSNGSETNQFMIDLPSPAAALFYSENSCESPPATKKDSEGNTSGAGVTFSTFRPDDPEENAKQGLEEYPQQQQQQQYFPDPPSDTIQHPVIQNEYPPAGVRDSPLKVLGGGESSTESSTLVAKTNDSFSREDSLDGTTGQGGDHRPTDTAYYIAKELLMTERTYKKDLEVLCVWFRNAVSCEPTIHTAMHELLFQHLDPIYNFHYGFLKEVEQRLAAWEGKVPAQTNGECQKIGDLMLKAINNLQEIYQTYFQHLEEILTEIDTKVKRQRPFEEICRGFESQKVCYLPLNTFFLRPGQRLLHFKLILERKCSNWDVSTQPCASALCQVTEIIQGFIDGFRKVENLEKLMELQRDLLGLENLVHLDREFVREGCLQKFSRKGYQQRMFFLFSDMLVYTSRTSASLLLFKVHGQLPLRGMTVEETDQSKSSVQNSFAIYAGNKYILVAASSPEEKDKWIEDINEAVQRVKQLGLDKLLYPSLKSSASDGENVDGDGDKEREKPIQHRANTTMHVCWHRNTSVSMRDHDKALKNQLSGYLLRKFKTSNGWQKLWVVFTNFCLFFYKTYQDDLPLASLPLLGYAVSVPEDEDGIHKDHVFKLQFKNHVYFFRAESEFTFARWMEVINSATHNARRTRLFSRLDSKVETS
ncbi:hypothetical protein EGW08_020216, partial [Elysia chlorotica]